MVNCDITGSLLWYLTKKPLTEALPSYYPSKSLVENSVQIGYCGKERTLLIQVLEKKIVLQMNGRHTLYQFSNPAIWETVDASYFGAESLILPAVEWAQTLPTLLNGMEIWFDWRKCIQIMQNKGNFLSSCAIPVVYISTHKLDLHVTRKLRNIASLLWSL